MDVMLRKFFHVGLEENNASVAGSGGSGSTASDSVPTPVVASSPVIDSAAVTSFGDLETQLDVFEGRIRDVINVLSRQCQAITEAMESSKEMSSCARLFYETNDTQQASGHFCRALGRCVGPNVLLSPKAGADENKDEAAVLQAICDFRSTCIAPLQTVRATIPPLKVRCGHRHSAESVVSRYEQKMSEIRASRRVDRARERRNQAKLDAAVQRFEEIDADLRIDIAFLLAKNIGEIVGESVESLLTRAQVLFSQVTKARAEALSAQLARSRNAVAEKKSETSPAHDARKDVNNGAGKRVHPLPSSAQSCEPGVSKECQPLNSKVLRIMPKHILSEKHSICPPKKHTCGTRTWNLHRHIKDSMATGMDLAECIKLPDGYQLEEWVAVHVIDFFNEISLLYGTISEFCTSDSCPQMSAGPCYTYLWADGVQQVTPVTLPAPEYVDRLLKWVESQLDDPQFFPSGTGGPPFSCTAGGTDGKLLSAVRTILKRLFRVYAHMYHSHLQNYVALHAESHLHFCFKRFVLFVKTFDLVEQKELNALRKLIVTLLAEQ